MIGIVTPYKTINYGTKLQAYAMQKLFSKYEPTEIILFNSKYDFRPNAILGKISPDSLKRKKNQNTQISNLNDDQLKRRNAIKSFDKYYNFSNMIKNSFEFSKKVKKYSSVVCGSDQLWAPSNVKADWYTLTIVPNSINKFSYAASFGISEIPNNMKTKYKKYLNKLDSIAVRENTGKKIVEELTDKKPILTLDPTLMLDSKDWEEITNESTININEPYIFCYFLGTNSKHREYVKKFAKEKNYKIVNFPFFKEWNEADDGFADIDIYEATPCDFLNLIKNSQYVFTDSFHGSVFSIIFNKNFIVFERFAKNDNNSTNDRIYSLLNMLELDDRLINDFDYIDYDKKNIDYDKVNTLLNNERKKSLEYISIALSKKKRD